MPFNKALLLFYQKIGFEVYAGSEEMNYLIMKNGNAIVGLFQGMFEGNILTFNPGWDENAQKLDAYNDIREIQKDLKEKGLQLEQENFANSEGPASFVVVDPDGNPVLIDQHV